MNIDERALNIIATYNGDNDYINYIKNKINDGNYTPTRNQSNYIIRNYKLKPVVKNIWVPIHSFVGSKLQYSFDLSETPKKVFIYKILENRNGSLHVYGKINEQDSNFYCFYLSKNGIIVDKQIPELNLEKYNHRPPKDFQITGIKSLLSKDRFILADEMGSGKTLQAIIAALEGGYNKILVVCTASLKYNWKREIEHYEQSDNISIVDGKNWKSNKWVIINYDIIKNFHNDNKRIINDEQFDLVIADEAHALKNKTSKRSKLFFDFSQYIKTVWLLTGTPVTNKPVDYYNLLRICKSPLADNWVTFVKRYCKGFQVKTKNKTFWKVDGASNLDELKKYTSDIILRRKKEDILDLPDKINKPVYLHLNDAKQKEYNKIVNEYKEWAKQHPNESQICHLQALIKCRQFLANEKLSHTIELTENALEQGNKVIIFSCFTDTIDYLKDHFKNKAVVIKGSVKKDDRDKAVTDFQNKKNKQVFIGQIVAAGVGLNLVASNTVIFNDLDWSPSNHAQASDRSHRYGQEKDVHILYPLFEDTLDTKMFNVLEGKIENIDKIMGDDKTSHDVASEVLKILT